MHQTTTALLLVVFSVAGMGAAEVPDATDLLTASVAYHDPEGRFLGEAHQLSFRETRPGGPDGSSVILINVPSEHFEMTQRRQVSTSAVIDGDQCVVSLDGREPTATEVEEHRLGCDRMRSMRDYYTYLWGLPMKLSDPGTNLGPTRADTFNGIEVYTLQVTYDPEVGNDIWYFHFDRTTSALVGYRFYHDEKANDGEYIVLEGEVQAHGLRLPKSRTWYTHTEDKLLGTDHLEAISLP